MVQEGLVIKCLRPVCSCLVSIFIFEYEGQYGRDLV